MPSKLGVHVNFITEANTMRDFILQARPVVVKTLHHDALFWQEIKAEYPELLLIGRRYVEYQHLTDPLGEAEEMAQGILSLTTAHLYDAWEGYNETPRSQLEARCAFDIHLADRLHQEEVRYIAGSWSVGVPDVEDWLRPAMLDALRAADFIGVHEYCAPSMDDPRGLDPQDPTTGWFTLRYRKWYPLLPPDCRKPLLITECGIDSGACHWDPGSQGGWRAFTNAQGYLEQLAWYDGILQGDDYVAGAAIFCWGTLDPTWDSFDLRGEMIGLLADYLVEQGEAGRQPPLPENLQGLRARLEELEAENASLAQQLEAAQARIEELEGEKASLSEQLSGVLARIQDARKVLMG